MRLRSQTALFRVFHARLDFLRIIRSKGQRCAQQQLAFAKRSVSIIPFDAASRNLSYAPVTSDSDVFSYRAYLMAKGAGVHPQGAPNRSRNSSQAFDTRQPAARGVDAKARQRITSADGNATAIELWLGFQFFHAQNHVMMIAVIREHVAA